MHKFIKDQLNGTRILISGGTGFIGKNILKYIKNNSIIPEQITIITRNKSRFINNYPEFSQLNYVDYIENDICSLTYNGELYDYVIHGATAVVEKVAAKQLLHEIIAGSKAILDFAVDAQVKSLINLSSGAVYGEITSHIPAVEDQLSKPAIESNYTSYGWGKIVAEHYGYLYASDNLKVTSLRCFAFGGEYMDHNHYALGDFIWHAIQDKDFIVKAGSGIYRSYLAIDDLIEAILYVMITACSRSLNYEVYNTGSAQAISIAELAQLVVKVLHSHSKITYQNLSDKKVSYYVPNVDKIKTLGLHMSSALKDIVLTTAKYYRSMSKVEKYE